MIGRCRRRGADGGEGSPDDEYVQIDVEGLTDAFVAPRWLRDLGVTTWLLVGVALFLVGAVWLMSLTDTIVTPVITAGVVASVGSPVVGWLRSHGVPRGVGAGLLLLLIVVVGAGVLFVVLVGITSETANLKGQFGEAKDTIACWLKDLGVSPGEAQQATKDASATSSDAIRSLLDGVAGGIEALSSLVFFLSLTALSLFFLLKDGPLIRKWGERHLSVPESVVRTITNQTLRSLRGYFLGVTILG